MNILRMTAVYNEADILQQNIDWYYERGFPSVVVDNMSTDGSFEICEKALAEGKIIDLAQIETDGYEWDRILHALINLAKKQSPDWFMLASPDEFFEPAAGGDLKGTLLKDINSGYNLVKFYNMEFWMTDADDMAEPDILKRIRHYSLFDAEMYRAYPNLEGLDIVTKFGHAPVFPDSIEVNICPTKYISRHYKLRSIEQARRKITRVRPIDRLPHINTHYQHYSGDASEFTLPAGKLHRYAEDHNWNFKSVYDGNRRRKRVTQI